jgi:hypothetical protein
MGLQLFRKKVFDGGEKNGNGTLLRQGYGGRADGDLQKETKETKAGGVKKMGRQAEKPVKIGLYCGIRQG